MSYCAGDQYVTVNIKKAEQGSVKFKLIFGKLGHVLCTVHITHKDIYCHLSLTFQHIEFTLQNPNNL